MPQFKNPDDTKLVGRITAKDKGVQVSRPRKVITGSHRMNKMSFPAAGSTMSGSGGNFYSPELSTDFLELPQSIDEKRNYYRFFYDYEPFVAQSIDLHTELPLSKLRLVKPKTKNKELAAQALRFCEKWAKKIGLLHRLMEIVHDFFLIGEVFIFCEDDSPDMPEEVRFEIIREVGKDGEISETKKEREDGDERAVDWLIHNYSGWSAIRVLPPEQVHMESFPFTDEKIMELIPDAKSRGLIEKAEQGDPTAIRIVKSMAKGIVEAIQQGQNIPLNTDPSAGSFVHYMAHKKSQYEERGKSLLQRCLRTLVFRDKVRQALTSIASRHMTPNRLIYAEDMNDVQTEDLRDQVDLALQDPDYSIITNFQVTWEEMGADQRLPDWSWVWDFTDRQMYAGLGTTESLLSGEGSYSGDKINLEVINTRYMLLRETARELVEQAFFEPMCRRMGFMEEDEDGILQPVVPGLSFTRLALRDNADTFDALFNLYQKGSLDIDVILDLLNIDPDTTEEKLKKDLFTLKDATYNELVRSIYTRVGDALAEHSNIAEKIAEDLGLKYEKPEEGAGGGRF